MINNDLINHGFNGELHSGIVGAPTATIGTPPRPHFRSTVVNRPPPRFIPSGPTVIVSPPTYIPISYVPAYTPVGPIAPGNAGIGYIPSNTAPVPPSTVMPGPAKLPPTSQLPLPSDTPTTPGGGSVGGGGGDGGSTAGEESEKSTDGTNAKTGAEEPKFLWMPRTTGIVVTSIVAAGLIAGGIFWWKNRKKSNS